MAERNPVYSDDLSSLRWLETKAKSVAPGTFKSEAGVRLEDGLIVLPNLGLSSGTVVVDIAAPGACYPGIAFRLVDSLNFELVYAQPHTSGLWDALQYDPVFHGSNTWQVFHGAAFQQKAVVPVNEWFTFRVEFEENRALAAIEGQPALEIAQLATQAKCGSVGLWTYQPAYFKNLRVYDKTLSARFTSKDALGTTGDRQPNKTAPSAEADSPGLTSLPPGTIREWFADGYGVVMTEPHGILLLNRYFPVGTREVHLTRRFTLANPSEARIALGFSDHASVAVDGEEVFSGVNLYRPSPDRAGRGYVQHGTQKIVKKLAEGEHKLAVKVAVKEGFGWGLAAAITATGLELLPANSL